jgi:phospholipase/carboxylesterase
MSEFLQTIEIETAPQPEAAVIWLHGLGADGNDFVPIVDELDLLGMPALRFVFPNAPMRPVTINGGMVMRAWYDITSLDFAAGEEDEAGIRDSSAILTRLITRETARGIAEQRIVAAGFSQGGAIVLHGGLRHPARLAGVLALSTYLPLRASFAAEAADANRDMPIFMAHGVQDAVIPFAHARQSCEQLRQSQYRIEWHEYPVDHGVCVEEIRDLNAWLRGCLGS